MHDKIRIFFVFYESSKDFQGEYQTFPGDMAVGIEHCETAPIMSEPALAQHNP